MKDFSSLFGNKNNNKNKYIKIMHQHVIIDEWNDEELKRLTAGIETTSFSSEEVYHNSIITAFF